MKIFYTLILVICMMACSEEQPVAGQQEPRDADSVVRAAVMAIPVVYAKHTYTSYYGFLDTLISRKDIIVDRDFVSPDANVRTDTVIDKRGRQLVASLPVEGHEVSYHAYLPPPAAAQSAAVAPRCHAYFKVNDKLINCRAAPMLDIGKNAIEKFTFRGRDFIYLSAALSNCKDCHTGVHHLFALDENEVTLNTITNHSDLTGLIYGDLNGDENLECLVIKNAADDPDAFNVQEQEKLEEAGINPGFCYKIMASSCCNGRWKSLADSSGKPYYIFVELNNPRESESFRIIDYYWMNKL